MIGDIRDGLDRGPGHNVHLIVSSSYALNSSLKRLIIFPNQTSRRTCRHILLSPSTVNDWGYQGWFRSWSGIQCTSTCVVLLCINLQCSYTYAVSGEALAEF